MLSQALGAETFSVKSALAQHRQPAVQDPHSLTTHSPPVRPPPSRTRETPTQQAVGGSKRGHECLTHSCSAGSLSLADPAQQFLRSRSVPRSSQQQALLSRPSLLSPEGAPPEKNWILAVVSEAPSSIPPGNLSPPKEAPPRQLSPASSSQGTLLTTLSWPCLLMCLTGNPSVGQG